MVKFITITGGIISSLGKGSCLSSIGFLLKQSGYRITAIKIDPYLNVDAGTIAPKEHGEVFVLSDGGECDLDLGNYERWMDLSLTRNHNITYGKIMSLILNKERKGEYLGQTIQIIPHFVDEIINWIQSLTTDIDICLIEVGGTVGDIESAPFIEALRQLQWRHGNDSMCNIHVSLLPIIGGEHKTKPTQQSVQKIRALGLTPDIVICRSASAISDSIKNKLSMFCNLQVEHVLDCHDVQSLYDVPLLLHQQNVINIICSKLKMAMPEHVDIDAWLQLTQNIRDVGNSIGPKYHIAMVAKYAGYQDTYTSIVHALKHASYKIGVDIVINWIDTNTYDEIHHTFTPESKNMLEKCDGILVPGGFGDRGIEAKIHAATYARINNKPYFGICLGMQIALIEFARNVLGYTNANSEEFATNDDKNILIYMPEISKTHLGGTMRVGTRSTRLDVNSKSFKLYNAYGKIKYDDIIEERHRHRYEFDSKYLDEFEAAGCSFVGKSYEYVVSNDNMGASSSTNLLVNKGQDIRASIIEYPGHKFFVGCQFHPEFKSRPLDPCPLFLGFIESML